MNYDDPLKSDPVDLCCGFAFTEGEKCKIEN